MKAFSFTVDDSILFLKDLKNGDYKSVLEHPLLSFMHTLHEKCGLKVQFNLFFREGDFVESDNFSEQDEKSFTLADMTDKFKSEWETLSDWIKFSFHSDRNNVNPYCDGKYTEIFNDCKRVQNEIIRFASEKSLAKTTTIHYVRCYDNSLTALKDNGVKGLLCVTGNKICPRISYGLPLSKIQELNDGKIIEDNGLIFSSIDAILNELNDDEINYQLNSVKANDFMKIMNHEMHFYPYDKNYQWNFCNKLESAVDFLVKNNFESVFFEDVINYIRR